MDAGSAVLARAGEADAAMELITDMPTEKDVRGLMAKLTSYAGPRLRDILEDWKRVAAQEVLRIRAARRAAMRVHEQPSPEPSRKLFPQTPRDDHSPATGSVTENLHREWAAAAERERQRKRDQPTPQEAELKPTVFAKVVKTVQRDDDTAGEFEIVTDHTGALDVVWIRVVKGCDPAHLMREVKLVLGYSNIEQMWGNIVQLCDKHNARQSIQVVADQDSINAALQGQQEVTLRLRGPDEAKGTKFTITRWDNVKILAEAGRSLPAQPSSHGYKNGPKLNAGQAAREGMGNVLQYAASPPYTVEYPYLFLWGQGEVECPGRRVTYEDAPWAGIGKKLREAQTEVVHRSGMWVVSGTTERRNQSRSQLKTFTDAQDLRGIGHALEDQYRMALVEKELRVAGRRVKQTKKSARGIPTDKPEAEIQWGTIRPPPGMSQLQEAGVVEWQVVHVHSKDQACTKRLGMRRVRWVASSRKGDKATERPVGRFEYGGTSFEMEVGRDWESMGIILLVHLQVHEAQRSISWTMDIHDAMRLVYTGAQLKQWRRADGGLAHRRLPVAEASIAHWWAHYCQTTQWQTEHTDCTVWIAPVAGALRVCVQLPRGGAPEPELVMQGDH